MADVEDAREPRTDSVFETLGHEVRRFATCRFGNLNDVPAGSRLTVFRGAME